MSLFLLPYCYQFVKFYTVTLAIFAQQFQLAVLQKTNKTFNRNGVKNMESNVLMKEVSNTMSYITCKHHTYGSKWSLLKQNI